MKFRHPKKWVVGGAVGIIAVAAAGGGVAMASASANAPSSTAGSTTDTTGSSGTDYLQTPLVQQFAAEGGVTALKVLVSAGPGLLGSNSSAVIVGVNSAGESCWTVVGSGGGVGGAFRCGGTLGEEAGEPADQQVFRVGCSTSGSPDSTTADSASCIGFVGSSVANVNAELADGSTQSMTVTDGAFAYAASSSDKLPTAFVATDESGQVVGQQDVPLSSGLGSG